MTGADDAGEWRDLADQLTPEQVAELERTEQSWEQMAQSRSPYLRNASTGGDDRRRGLLSMARLRATENSVRAKLDRLAAIAAPPDISNLQPWDEQHQENGVWFRDFKAGAWPVEWRKVVIEGRQYEDGRCERAIHLRLRIPDEIQGDRFAGMPLSDPPLTRAQTGELADALRTAAGRVEEHSHVGVPPDAPQAVRRRWRTGEWQSVVGKRIMIEPGQDPVDRDAPQIWVDAGTGPGWTPAQARELATALEEAAGQNAAPAAEAAPRPAVWEATQAASVSSSNGRYSPRQPAAVPRPPSTGVIAQLRGGSAWWRALSIALALSVLTQFGLLWQRVSRWNSGIAAWVFIAVAFVGFVLLFAGERRPAKVFSIWALIILFGGAILDLVLTSVSPK